MAVTRRAVTHGLLGVWAVAAAGGISARADNATGRPVGGRRFFTAAEFAFVTAYADTLLPSTDTPGAVQAGVPALLDHMMTTWAGKKTRGDLRQLLVELQKDLVQDGGRAFAEASSDSRLSTLRAVDARRFAGESAPSPGPYRQFKILIARIYYSTRIGATVELRYEPIPGDWKSDIPFSDIGRCWAK